MIIRKIQHKNETKKAFVSMFAIFFSAIVTSVMTALYILLVKQIVIMNFDASSFQALYMADSAFECAVYKEQIATGTRSYFLPSNYSQFGNCGNNSDVTTILPNTAPPVVNNRATTTIQVSMETNSGSFCGFLTVGKQTNNSDISNKMLISGLGKACSSTENKVIERVIEFTY